MTRQIKKPIRGVEAVMTVNADQLTMSQSTCLLVKEKLRSMEGYASNAYH
jgi:hypothetical protein